MKTGLLIAVMALAMVLGSGHVGSGIAMMGGGMGHGGGMSGHGGGVEWGGHGSQGGWGGSAMGSGSMQRQSGTSPDIQSGSGHQRMSSDPGEGLDRDRHGHGASDVQETMDGQQSHGVWYGNQAESVR